MNYLDIQFQWYNKGIKTIKPQGLISLKQFIQTTISPKPEMIEAFRLINEAAVKGDKAEKDRLKTEKLFFTTPSVIVDPIRNYESVRSFNPFCVVEYDNIPYAEELRDYIFEKHKSCIFAFLSPSKTGVKYIFHIETPKSIPDYKELFFGLAAELDAFCGLDISNERATQPLFNSYDPNAKFREDAVPSVRRGYKTNAFIESDVEVEIPETAPEEDKTECFRRIAAMVDKIEGVGHNSVVSSAFTAGGFCSYYGISKDEMWDILEDRVRDNTYLSKGTNGYLKTAHTMFYKGVNFPTPLKK